MVALVALLGVGVGVGVWSFVSSSRKRRDVFDARQTLTDDELVERYYADSGLGKELVVRLWNECARALRVPAGKLRPSDRFEQELGAANFWASLDDPQDDLAEYARRHAQRFGASIDLKRPKTLDDFVRRLAAIEAGGAPTTR